MKTTHCVTALGLLASIVALASFTGSPCQANVLIELDLSGDTATNVSTDSGNFGDGTVNINENGYWTDRNSTGIPSGRVFNTGANGMGSLATNTPDVGTISWTNAQANLSGLSQFSTYIWLQADTTIGNSTRIISCGSTFQIYLETTQVGVRINNETQTWFVADLTTVGSEWFYMAYQFDNGAATIYFGTAEDENLISFSYTASTASLGTNTNDFVLGNINNIGTSRNRPFDGSIGGYYLSDSSSLDVESTFDAQKQGFVAVPESSTFSLMGGLIVLAFALRKLLGREV